MAETTTGRHVRPDALNDVMAFDHVIRVHPDGTVTEPREVWAPEPIDSDGTLSTREGEPWELVTGYSGQYGYAGPVMHPSEYIGGGMARNILSRPGLWVAVVVPAGCDEDCPDGCEDDHDPAGWAVAHIPDGDGAHRVWTDEIVRGGRDAWQGMCACGWTGPVRHFDAFTDREDPADAAHDAAEDDARGHAGE